jgi:hypothetical protein
VIGTSQISGYITGKRAMTSSQRKAVSNHRQRLKRRGIVRLEVRVLSEDVALVRALVEALADPDRANETRTLLRERFATRPKGLKELLAEAPLEGIDLRRSRDTGRDVAL